jgi:hypothetical protein
MTEKNINELLVTGDYPEKVNSLSSREKTYLNIMKAQAGVLYITSKPGLAKSSIARSIAKKMGFQYMDIRLSMVDETDVGLYPQVEDVDHDGNQIKCLNFVVPKWAIKANSKPTIIHFEELNRASLNVRNAALQILLEREIGTEFEFNNNVLMLCSGNLGEEDGTDVEEFDSALNNRLIHVRHDLQFEEWVEQFADDNIHPLIVAFIKNNAEYLYRKDGTQGGEEPKTYASPRTWHFLSEYIMSTLGDREGQMKGKYDINEVKALVKEVGQSYVGTSIAKFIKYLDETMQLSVYDILNNYDKVKKRIEKANRDKKSELLGQLREMELSKLKERQVNNLIKFLDVIDEDERVGFFTEIIDHGIDEDLKKPPLINVLRAYKTLLKQISSMSA